MARIHNDGGKHRLEHTDDYRLSADLFQLRQTELIAHGKGNKAKGQIRQDPQTLDLFLGNANARNVQSAQCKGADQNTGNQVGRNRRKLHQLGNSGQQETAEQCNRQAQQNRPGWSHIIRLLSKNE